MADNFIINVNNAANETINKSQVADNDEDSKAEQWEIQHKD